MARPFITEEVPDLAVAIVDGTLDKKSIKLPMVLSGACEGADETFGDMAIKAGHKVAHFLGPGDEEWAGDKAKTEQQFGFFHVSEALLNSDAVNKAFDKASDSRVLKSQRAEGWREKVANMAARRNFLQVHCADMVFAVGWRLKEGFEQFTGRETCAPEETPKLDVGGGTGWACQWYVDRFGEEDAHECQLYFFDDGGPPWAREESDTIGRWNLWDVKEARWRPLDIDQVPKPDGLYAGIGATRLSDRGKHAILSLYEKK